VEISDLQTGEPALEGQLKANQRIGHPDPRALPAGMLGSIRIDGELV
jgi:hypothetical protein